MRRTRLLAISMAFILLVSAFTSCTKSGGKGNNKVKADDPWYESTRFKLEKSLRENDDTLDSNICTSNDRFFSIYTSTNDMYATTRIVLDAYDYSGNLVSRKEVKCPDYDNFRIYNIYSVKADPEGKTIKSILSLSSGGVIRSVFADIDTETGIASNIKPLLSGRAEKYLDSNENMLYISSLGEYAVVVLASFEEVIADFHLLLFKDTEFVNELDLSTSNIRAIEEGFLLNEATDSIFAVGWETADYVTLEFDLNNGKLKSKQIAHTTDDDSIDLSKYTATDNGDLCKLDSLGNIMKLDIVNMTAKTVIDTNWYTPLFQTRYCNEHIIVSTVMSCTDDRVVIKDYESFAFGGLDSDYIEYVRVIKKADKNPHAGKEIIEISLPDSGITDYLVKTIYEFNRTDNEYLIRLWDKHKTGAAVSHGFAISSEDEQKEYKIIQDLKSNEAPDLAVGIQKNYAMRDDVFMDLTGFLDPEVLDKQYSNVFEAGRFGGKLYFLPVTLEIEGMVTNVDLIPDGADGITFEEYEKLTEEKMYGYSAYDYPYSDYYNKKSFLLSCIDTKSAIEGDKIEFGTDQFRFAAEYAKENIRYDDIESTPIEYFGDWKRYRGECYYTKIDDYLDFVRACRYSKKNYKIIGTPSVDASGPRFRAIETISVSVTTDVKDGCKKFLNYLFSGSAYNSSECDFLQIVTNKEIMNKNIEALTKINNIKYEKFENSVKSGAMRPAAGYDKAFGDKVATDSMRESFQNSLSTISTYYYEDNTITQIVFEELAPYFAGDRSLDDVIRYLNDRASKYIREM